MKIPRRLRKDPILEAIVEIRFEASQNNVASILPGLLFSKLRDHSPRLETLMPIGAFPPDVLSVNPELRYVAQTRLSIEGFNIQIGDNSIGISAVGKYPGGEKFYARALEIFGYVKESNLVRSVERFSIKYINLLEAKTVDEQLALTNLSILLGGEKLMAETLNLRVDLARGLFLNIVQVVSRAVAVEPPREGVVLDVDTICAGPFNDFWKEFPSRLSDARVVEKELFFSFLKQSTIEALDPEY